VTNMKSLLQFFILIYLSKASKLTYIELKEFLETTPPDFNLPIISTKSLYNQLYSLRKQGLLLTKLRHTFPFTTDIEITAEGISVVERFKKMFDIGKNKISGK